MTNWFWKLSNNFSVLLLDRAIPCGEGVGDSSGEDDVDDVGVTMAVDVIVVVIGATVVVMVTALQLLELKIMYDVQCGIIDSSTNAVDVPMVLAGVSVMSVVTCTDVLVVGASGIISVVDICDTEITTYVT